MDAIDTAGTWVPQACTLPTAEQPLRVAEFDALLAASLTGIERPEPTRARLLLEERAEPVARDLAARETGCCSFFVFDFRPAGTAAGVVAMDVSVPAAQVAVLDALVARAEAAGAGAA